MFLLFTMMQLVWAQRCTFDQDTGKLMFDLKASLHEIKGKSQQFTGEVNIGPGSDHTGQVLIPTKKLTTGLDIRDNRMYDYVLQTEKYPTIIYKIRSIEGDVEGLDSGKGKGSITFHGTLQIATMQKDISIKGGYEWDEATGEVKLGGKTTFLWTDFNLPDPSIQISTLFPPVNVKFVLKAKPSK